MKAGKICSIAATLLLSVCISCFHAKKIKKIETEYGALLPVRVKVIDYVNHFTDSCLKNGIDTLLVFSTYYSGQPLYRPVDYSGLGKKYTNGKYEPVSFSSPSYIFWKKEGHYFVKKVDQFNAFPTIERGAYQDYQLYDYFKRNQNEISSEREQSVYGDSASGYQHYAYISGSSPGKFYQKQFAPNTIYIRIALNEQSFSKTIDKFKYQPLIETTDSTKSQNKYGNDQQNYYKNQQLKIYQWVTLIEGELFDIESRGEWIRN